MTNGFQPFKQSGFEFGRRMAWSAAFLTFENRRRQWSAVATRGLTSESVVKQPVQGVSAGTFERWLSGLPAINQADGGMSDSSKPR